MTCPHCGGDITRHVRKANLAKAQAYGAKGGSAKGETKRRDVDYSALGKAGAAKREAMKHLYLILLLSLGCAAPPPSPLPTLTTGSNSSSSSVPILEYSPVNEGCYRVEWGPWKCQPNLRIRLIAKTEEWECFLLEELREGEWRESKTVAPVCARRRPIAGVVR